MTLSLYILRAGQPFDGNKFYVIP